MSRLFFYAYDDTVAEFTGREAAAESRAAAINSHHAGRAMDSFGFAARTPTSDRPSLTGHYRVMDSATRLALARTRARDRAAMAEAKRRTWTEAVVLPIRDVMDYAELWPETHWFLWGDKRKVP